MTTNISTLHPSLNGLRLIHSGKVRDTYEIPAEYQPAGKNVRLVVASDRISVFDHQLPVKIEGKGQVLNAMNIFWRRTLQGIPHDMLAYGADIDKYLPLENRDSWWLQSRATVVESLLMLPIECIARGYITGSAWEAYKSGTDRVVCGHTLPEGLVNGSRLPKPLFTPTTKAVVGHDEHMDHFVVSTRYGARPEEMTLDIYNQAEVLAAARGIIVVDTKIEMGMVGDTHKLADEVLTPDSSRFWLASEYEQAMARGKVPDAYDKQVMREYAKTLGINKLDPTNPVHRAQVCAMEIDPHVIDLTALRYFDILNRITGKDLVEYLVSEMGVGTNIE